MEKDTSVGEINGVGENLCRWIVQGDFWIVGSVLESEVSRVTRKWGGKNRGRRVFQETKTTSVKTTLRE